MKSQNKGITLIALIITIIILLILAVVTIMAVNGDGIISKAKQAKAEYQNAQAEEQNVLDKYLAEMEGLSGNDTLIIEGNKSSGIWTESEPGIFVSGEATIKIGDYVDYTYDDSDNVLIKKEDSGYDNDQSIPQTKDLQWKVMGITDNGELELISATVANSELIFLCGSSGLSNGIDLLNNTCKSHYTNNSLGTTAKNNSISSTDTTYTWENVPYSYFNNEEFYKMIFETETNYWLTTKGSNRVSYSTYEYMQKVDKNNLSAGLLVACQPGYSARTSENYIRPVVTLGTDIVLITNDNENSTTNMWKLIK